MLKWIVSILAVVYALSPYDLIPDFLVGWGWLDDVILLVIIWQLLRSGVNPLRYFRAGQDYYQQQQQYRQQQQQDTHTGKDESTKHQNDDRQNSAKDTTAPQDPYTVLGLAAGASREEIRQAYKRLAGKYHPDKVDHLGPEFKALAEKRFKEIQQAYETLHG